MYSAPRRLAAKRAGRQLGRQLQLPVAWREGAAAFWAWAGRAYKAACAVPQCQGGQQRALFACLLPLYSSGGAASASSAPVCATTRAPLAQPRLQVALCAVVCVWVLLPVPCQGGCWR